MPPTGTERRTILFLHPSAELYGADRTLLDLVQGLDPERQRAVVILPRRGTLAARLEAAGATVEVGSLGIGARASMSVRGLLRLAVDLPRGVLSTLRIARRHDPQVIHTNTMIVLGGAIAARLLPARHIWHVHEIPPEGWLTRAFARLFDLLAQRVVCNSHATAEHFRRARPQLSGKLDVVWNGTHLGNAHGVETRAEGDSQLRDELGLTAAQPLVLLIGRINSWKGQQLLVRAAAHNRARHPQARYVIVGDGPPGQEHFVEALRASIRAADLEQIVSLRSFTTDPASSLRAADLVVVPSTRPEPFGLVAIEAMACDRPVVAADHGGLSEIVEHGETGLLFEPGDARALAQALHELLEDPERARRMGRAGRKRQQAFFTLERYCEAFQRIYATGRPPSSSRPRATKIVHLTLGKANPERMNGVNVVIHHLASAQRRAGFDVELWGLTDSPDAGSVEREHPVRFFQRRASRFRLPRGLARSMRDLPQPCLFHLHGAFLPEMHAAARSLARSGVPFVFTPHGAYRSEALRRRAWLKRLYLGAIERPLLRRARAIQAFAAAEAHDTARQLPGARVVIIPNGQALPDALPAPARSGLPGPLIGFCGRLDVHTKGLDLLLQGFARHVADGGAGSLVLIGDGPGREPLQARARATGIGSRVHFLGPRYGDPKLALLREFDVFALTSRHEGMPTAVLEAGSLGCALLVSPETNVADEVRAHRCGFALERNDPASIAAALGQAERDLARGELRRMGGRARRMTTDLFSWERIARRMATELYDLEHEAIDVSQRPAAPEPGGSLCRSA